MDITRLRKLNYIQNDKVKGPAAWLLICLLFAATSNVAHAADPVINTSISVDKTGSEPFDSATWAFPDLTTAGLDEDADNNVVRLQDAITYKVEISLNDSSVDDLTATVKLNEKQVWINIPTGCKVDAADVTAQPVSSISADGTELFCNLGPAIEGTTKVFFPPARAVGVDPATGDITLNNDVVTAGVTAGADGDPALSSDGPTEVIVTAFFRVDTIKEPKVNATDPDTGAFLYKAVSAEGPAGEAGWLIEYRVSAQYLKGSMIADSILDNFLADYNLIDFYTDDNDNNDAGGVSTGGVLYTWDTGLDACYLDGDHGATAAIACTVGANQDLTASNAPTTGYGTDGVDDPVINISLTNIDVRDPDGDTNLFEFVINVWFDQSADIRNHQGCVGTTCTVAILNDVAVDDPVLGITGFNPISTEDSSGTNLDNYNGAGEPIPNRNIYSLSESLPGTRTTYKSFYQVSDTASQVPPKSADQFIPAGATVPFYIMGVDNRLVDQSKTQICDKIDTSVYEFAGVSNGLGDLRWIFGPTDEPIAIRLWTQGVPGIHYQDASQYTTILYSTYKSVPEATPAVVANAATIAWHESLRDDTCEDDVNGDGIVNIKLNGQPAPDAVAPIDWYENPNEMPGGQVDTARIRAEFLYDKADMTAVNPAHDRFYIWAEFDLKVKSITEAYGIRNIMPNWASSRQTEDNDSSTYFPWLSSPGPVDDFEETLFSTEVRHADRNVLVPSGQTIEKYTEPRGLKVVRAGDVVDFIVEAKVFGLWDPAVDDARVWDNLPANTDYVVGSEMFSVDGGTTWLSRADYDASLPAVTITNAAHGVDADPLDWRFGDLQSGEQLPLIRYQVTMDPAAVNGTFTNIARIYDTGIGEQKQQSYALTILPEFGLDVVKLVDYPVYQTNEAFEFDLIYKNLGGEEYQSGEFIDILPYIGDGTGTTSGKASDREPLTAYSGFYETTKITASNGEIIYATSALPSTIDIDPCHESNHPAGSTPSVGDICYDYYTNTLTNPVKAANTFAGGAAAGTGTTTWVACATLDPLTCAGIANEDITAIRIEVPALGTSGGETISIELTPTGNVGGEPNLDALGNVTAGATGDIYTNTFGGRVPEISLNVISNDVSVTVVAGSIGDTVWFDLDNDGNGPAGVGDESDVTEPPVVGAAVALLDSAGDPIFIDPDTGGVVPADYVNPDTGAAAIPYVTVTDASGNYSFDNLPSGEYQVEVTPPAGSLPVYDADGIATPNISTHDLSPTLDAAGQLIGVEDNVDQDFGYRPPLQVGSTVWADTDNSGTQDPTEPGIAGVVVQLFAAGADPATATPIAEAVTDANGDYLLNASEPGDYFVYIPVPPSGSTLSSSPGVTDVLDNGVDGNDNGIQAVPGGGVSSPVIELDFGTEPVGAAESAVTGGDGTILSSEVIDDNGDMTVDFGFYPSGSIGDTIFFDLNGDGIEDAGETGIEGVVVTLTYEDLDGNPVTLSTTTLADGSYLFDDLPLGVDYTVTVDTSTLPGDLGTDYLNTADPDGGLNNTSMVTLDVANPNNLDQDFGYQPVGAIGDTIWYDANNDGIEDATELGIEGVTVTLTPAPDVDLGAGLGVAISTTTDADGEYLFEGLPPGDYTVEVDPSTFPAGSNYTQTFDDDGLATENASETTLVIDNTDPAAPTVPDDLDQDFGYVEPVSLGGLLWDDLNGDGLQDANEPAIAGSTVTLLNADGSPATDLNGDPIAPIVVGNDGQYIFDNLFEGDYIVQVTQPVGYLPSAEQNDADDDDTANDSNIASEPSAGVYQSGVFTLTKSEEPSAATEAQVGDDLDESATALASDTSGNMTVDFGFIQPASIGDTVWLDANNDGIQDANEDGLAGVTVNLYEDTDGDGVISGAEATTPVATVVTGPNGEYLFPDLTPGVVYQTGVDVTTIPDGLVQSFDEGDGLGATDSLSDPITLDPGELHDTADFGYAPSGGAIGDTIWIDVNDDGVQDPGELGIGGVVVNLSYFDDAGNEVVLTTTTAPDGTYLFTDLPLDTTFKVEVDTTTLPDGYVSGPSNLGDPDVRDGNSPTADSSTYITLTPDAPVNLEADFGYLPPEDQNNSIGDTIYLDEDGSGTQDGTEPGIEGVTVALVDADGNVLAVTTTDADGNYLFTGVPDGVYDIVVTDATGELSDYTQTGDPDGTLDNTSTVDVDSLSVDDEPVVDLDQDFGYQPPASTNTGVIGDTIFLDANNDGLPDAGEGLGGVVVELFDENGNLIASTVTDDNGNYLFTELETSVDGVSYEVRVDTSTLPAGLTNSVDPETTISGVGDSISTGIVLTDAVPENLDQDFGYTSEDMNTVSGTVWYDTDGNGLQDEGGVYAGVTVELRDEDGNVIQTTTTDADGNYEFTNLPDGIYMVVVTDEDDVLYDTSHTNTPNGASDTSDATSKNDQGYLVDLDSGGLDPNPVTDDTGDFGYEPIVTNPISLGSFSAMSITGGVQIDWTTQTEVSNLGFNIYAQVNDEWVELNDGLIVSQGDSVSIQTYSMTAPVSATVFALGDVDVAGLETVHGPFMIDQVYGEIGERQTIDWQSERAEREAKEASREAQRQEQQRIRNEQLRRFLQSQPTSQWNRREINEGSEMYDNREQQSNWMHRAAVLVLAAVIPSAHAQGSLEMDLINLKTTQAGIHQLRYEDLINQTEPLDLSGVPVNRLALMNLGEPVQIEVVGSSDDSNVFGANGLIRFIASQVDTLYSDTNVYTLRLVDAGSSAVQRVRIDGDAIPNGAAATAYLAKARFAPQSSYSFASPETDDPWYATRIIAAGEAASDSIQLELDNVAPGGNSGSTKAKLKVNVWGASTLSGANDDHSVKVKFNNTEVITDSFDGLAQREMNVTLNQVSAGNNTVEVVLPMDTGYAYDAVNVDEIEVSYPRQFVAVDDRLDFESTFGKFQVSGFNSGEFVVMREDSNGVSLQTEINLGSCRSSCSLQFRGTGELAHYYVAAVDALPMPVPEALPVEQDISSDSAQYLIISHPNFIGTPSLDGLAADLSAEMSVQIIDVEAIYAQYGYHVFDPAAIQAYIKDSVENRGTEYVLLIGGDVYDYRQFENEDATSFIPSIYASTGNSINFAPVDAKYVDLDNDNVPDLPIGRLPVRTVAQLDSLLNKRDDYIARTYNGKILLVADEYDVSQQYNFADDADEVGADLLSDFVSTKVYVDDLGASQARAEVIKGINAGQSLTAFFGHSSTNQWTFNGLFTGNDAAGLSNYDKPTVVTQWGCWNAYYVSPNEDSMGHRFMMEGDQGAVAVMGATTLTNANSERKLARLVLARIADGERLGDAITNAKQEYAVENPDDLDVLLGWTLLGLPDLVIN